MKTIITTLAVLLLAAPAMATDGYYRSPSLRGDLVVFTAEGDLWAYRLNSGQTMRLTTHPALETDAAISPDASTIAYVANYEGVREIYVMPVTGGVPQRITYENGGVAVQGWTPEGKVLFATDSRVGPPRGVSLKTVDPKTLETRDMPLADAADGDVDAAGNYLYFSQYGLRFDNVNQYRGGMLGKLWRYRLGGNAEAQRLAATHEGSIRRPQVDGNRIYFISDASGRENLWSADLDGSNISPVTDYDDFSVRAISIDNGRVVYRRGADLYLRQLSDSSSRKLDIRLMSDHPSMRESWINEPLNYLTTARLAGSGDKVAVTARGRIAIAGPGKKRLVQVATPTSARMRYATLSNDGQWVYAVSDAAGELELWRYSAIGADTAEQLTTNGDSQRGPIYESPDGKWIAHDDGHDALWLYNTDTGKNTRIITSGRKADGFRDVAWSPDSKLISLSYRERDDERPRIMLYEIETKRTKIISTDKYESGLPVFSRDGQWLYYLSNRRFVTEDSVWSDRDFGPAFHDRTQVFAHALTEDASFPFAIPTELTPADDDANGEDADETEETSVAIDWDGIEDRIWQVPVEAGDYQNLLINDAFLYLLTSSDNGAEIKALPIEPEPEAETFASGVRAMQLSNDGSKMLVVKREGSSSSMFIVPAEGSFPDDTSDSQVQVNGWQFSVDPRAEWRQIFHDAWLMHREQFYDPDMRGVDWAAMKTKYTPLLERVTDRHELNDVLGQMTGELNALHSAVRGGDIPTDPEAPSAAVLGAKLTQTAKGVVIERIYHHDSELPASAPPLAQSGVDAENGDIIVAVNGGETPTLAAVHRALRNQIGEQVLLQLKRGRSNLKTVVVPERQRADYTYRYRDWVERVRARVDDSNDDIGYLHIRNMGGSDVAAFARDFYALQDKKAIIIDVRRNGGGNVDSWIIDRLMRKAWMFWAYHGDKPYFNMQNTFRGHLAVLADQGTYSDGETFTAAIKALDIAPVFGVRTAGAGVWLSGRNRLSDLGIARVAEFPVYAMDGRWIVEGYGVEPTVEVENLPHATFNGSDAQLSAALDYLERKLKEEPVPEAVPQAIPPRGQPADDVLR